MALRLVSFDFESSPFLHAGLIRVIMLAKGGCKNIDKVTIIG